MHDLTRFGLSDTIACSATLRRLGKDKTNMEEVAHAIVDYLYQNLVDTATGEKCCTLVRFFKTHPYQKLPEELRQFVRAKLTGEPCTPMMKCLTLLATVGERPAWNHRQLSQNYKAIPLPNQAIAAKSPMFSQLIAQFGLQFDTVIEPDPELFMQLEQKNYNVFYVGEAVGSPYIPAQRDFVIPFGIKSVLGFGGLLPSSCDLFAIILFSKHHIPRETANLFKPLALSAKLSLLPFVGETIFHPPTVSSVLPT
ncbi:hypothetical protein [Phormidium sp. CCY1219]|uniref:hypothetical protein n=1 Tax=Phormidium sp. CCY1219 TaxID=2886104 RepID=UPI002D1ECA17|nr:hypothetical protein [Phormidium sp. CCY1219]MEB3826551.1 hypothetical protein [Phormidium sp. CCY1219]